MTEAAQTGADQQITFGGWLKQRRKELGITQEEIAERIDVSPVTLRKLEAGTRRPSGQVANLLADLFKVPDEDRASFIVFARTGQAVGRADDGKPAGQSPWHTPQFHRNNLPALLAPIIGRDADEAKVMEHLLNPRVRLLTLTGPPGIGKTSLALQVAARLSDEASSANRSVARTPQFQDGVFLVELATIDEPNMVMVAVARSLGLQEDGERATEGVVLDYLRHKRLFLLLDNFEQVLDAASDIVRLLEQTQGLKILVTSREALHVKGERRYPVPSLALPDLRHLPEASQLLQYSSVELFVERAQVVQPDFALTEQNALAVAAICVRLDGLPLAIELAAGHVSLLSPAEIADRLDHSLQLLKTRARDLPLRQRTLRGAIDWSYNLLPADERALFRRLGVFVAGWTIEAAAAVAGVPGLDTLEGLETLIDKSLISRVNKQEIGDQDDGEADQQLRLLETLKEYALEQLSANDEYDETRDRHARYYLAFVQQTEDILLKGDQHVAWLKRVDTHYANVHEALTWLLATPGSSDEQEHMRLEMGAAFCTSLWLFWDRQTYLAEAYEWYLTAAQRVEAFVLARTGDDSIAAAQSLSPDLPVIWARMLTGAGAMAKYRTDYEQARILNEQGLAMRRALGDKSGMAACLNNLGNVASDQGDNELARIYHTESLEIARELGIPWKLVAALGNLGVAETNLGNLDRARELLNESLEVSRYEEGSHGNADALNNLAVVERYLGNYAEARKYLAESFSVNRALNHQGGMVHVILNLGLIDGDEGLYEDARQRLREGLPLAAELNDRRSAAEFLEGLANVAGSTGNPRKGAQLYGAAAAVRDVINAPLSILDLRLVERQMQAVRDRLDPVAWEEAYSMGRAMPLQEAISYAMQD